MTGLNGIIAIFSDDIKWLLCEFENDKIELKEVTLFKVFGVFIESCLII